MSHNDLEDPTPTTAESGAGARRDGYESIAEAYEEEAAIPDQPADLHDLGVRVRKLEERLATIEDFLGTPAAKDSLEQRLQKLEAGVSQA